MSEQAANRVLERLREQGVVTRELSADSRAVEAGDVFLAYPGTRTDGRAHIGDAIARRAAAVLWEARGHVWKHEYRIPNLAVEGLQSLSGHLAHLVYGRPTEAMCMIGVTGTNGKTSVSQWVASAFELLGRKACVVGTLGAGFPGDLEAGLNTTPDAVTLHRLLARYRSRGAEVAAMEVSSIGLDQERVNAVQFDIAVFTNLTRDHLEYHGSMEAYAEAKAKLFAFPKLRAAVVNLDDPFGVGLGERLAGRGIRRIGYTLMPRSEFRQAADEIWSARDLDFAGAAGLRFTAVSPSGHVAIAVPMVGEFNVSNLLAVLATLHASGVAPERGAQAVNQLRPPPGRMQLVGGENGPLAVIDYAHTPDALEKALGALRATAKARGGKLICVFGCGGERDHGKRPLMGEVAVRLADAVILTSDNPRGEDPDVILAEIAHGAGFMAARMADRAQAIRRALLEAGPRDVVLIAGKGHEPYQEVAGRRLPFSDVDHAAKALAARNGGHA